MPQSGLRWADLHCDSVHRLLRGESLQRRSKLGHWDIASALKVGLGLQVFAAFSTPSPRKPLHWPNVRMMLLRIPEFVAANPTRLRLVLEATSWTPGNCGIIPGVEGAHGLDSSLENLRAAHFLGMRVLTITWNNSNKWATSANDLEKRRRFTGLTPEGVEALRLARDLGTALDVSHLGELAFWQLLQLVPGPHFASHSCCRALCDHFRNLTDLQMRALADSGGICGLNFCSAFLVPPKSKHVWDARVSHAADHVARMVDVAGADFPAVGSDWDGITDCPKGLESPLGLDKLAAALQAKGLKPSAIRKVAWQNASRYLSDAITVP